MIVVFYYTQSGQALDVAKRICQPLAEAGTEVVWRPIIPQQADPFPWNKYEFFDSFPETRLGVPPSGIQPLDFSGIEKAQPAGISDVTLDQGLEKLVEVMAENIREVWGQE